MLDNFVLQARVISFIFGVERNYVEYVIPEEMFVFDVILEFYFLFLEILALDVANVAQIGFVFVEGVVVLSQPWKSVDHDTRNNVTEQQTKENGVNGVIDKSLIFEWVHRLVNHSWDV